jgi:hypothetical protein
MPDLSDIRPEIVPIKVLLQAFASATPATRAPLIQRWREYLEEGRAGLKRQADHFERLYRDAARNPDLQYVKELSTEAQKQRQEEAGHIQPVIDVLLESLATHAGDAELSSVLTEAVEIARGTLKNFDILGDRLLALTSDRAGHNQVMRAHPVEGEIDHAGLSREHIARYPKIRARLAE